MEIKIYRKGDRLFNKKYFYHEGIIHEQIVSFDGKGYETKM
jgi:hypothetical protein